LSIPIKYKTDGTQLEGVTPLVILGPNGSGKTRYGLELSNWNGAENIAALRNIALEENIPMQSLTQATQELVNHKRQRTKRPWTISSEINNLFAKLMAEDSAAAVAFRDNYEDGIEPEITKLMKLQKSWHTLFPGRKITFGGYSPKVTSEYTEGEAPYPAQSMSDGERVALYLAGKVLDANSNIIIIDEPEVHFHSRLAIQFWDELEKLRSDCRFVYITHDLAFARSRCTHDFLIIRPGQEPDLINIDEGIPPDIAEDILSAASFSIHADRIIFCEGSESSYDQRLFRSYYNGRTDAVIPVGSCKDVIKCTATFRDSNFMDGVTAHGLIDRDYWPEVFINSIPDGVHIIQFHEVESLFCESNIFVSIATHLGRSQDQANILYQEFLQESAVRFVGGLLLKQISERFKTRCSEQVNIALNSLSIDGNEEDVKTNHRESLAPSQWNVSPDDIFEEEKALIANALIAPFNELISLLPGKVYLGILVGKVGITKEAYIDLICKSLDSIEGEPLHELGQTLRGLLSGMLPND
jgi:hypothetical protein